MSDEELKIYQELLDLVVYTADSEFNNLYGEVIDLESPSEIRKVISQIEDLIDYEMKPLIAKLEELDREADKIMKHLSLMRYKRPEVSVEELYSSLELIKEENALKENTYTISYKKKVNDEWVLVTKTGRSDSKEAKDIMKDLIAEDISDEHLEVLMNSFEVGEKLTEFIEEGKHGINE